jgi:hypothetical protein
LPVAAGRCCLEACAPLIDLPRLRTSSRRSAGAGKTGTRGKDFNMRWVASMVADASHLSRGGIFMYPRDAPSPTSRASCG